MITNICDLLSRPLCYYNSRDDMKNSMSVDVFEIIDKKIKSPDKTIMNEYNERNGYFNVNIGDNSQKINYTYMCLNDDIKFIELRPNNLY